MVLVRYEYIVMPLLCFCLCVFSARGGRALGGVREKGKNDLPAAVAERLVPRV
jgi:hypothetical protein